MGEASREMTLQEEIERLPVIHRARREYYELTNELTRTREEVAEAREDVRLKATRAAIKWETKIRPVGSDGRIRVLSEMIVNEFMGDGGE